TAVPADPGSSSATSMLSSAAVIELQLDRMCRHAEAGDFLHLQGHVGIDHIVGEHATAGQELAIAIQMLQSHVERMAYRWNVPRLLGLEVIKVLVGRIAGMDAVLDAIEARHHH